MSQDLFTKFFQKLYGTVFGVILLSVALLTMNGCMRTISGQQERAAKNNNPVKTVGDFAGKWHNTKSSKFDYASYAENLGYFESYQISEDGVVRFETLNAARNYDCIVEVSTRSQGVISLAAGSPELNINLSNGTIRQTNSCAPDNNSTAATTASSTNYRWQLVQTEDGATELCLTKTDGKTVCYRRER